MVTGQPRVPVQGWQPNRDVGFTARHPALNTRKGAVQLRLDDAPGITNDEFRDRVPPWQA